MDWLSELIDPSQMLVFWPSKTMTDAEKLNASTRFIIYASIIIYATRRDPKVFPIGLISIFVLVFCYKRQVQAAYHTAEESVPTEKCRLPTPENPAGNRLLGPGYLDSAPLCDDPNYINSMISQRQILQPQQALFGGEFDREFYSTPLAMDDWPAGQKKFAEWLGAPLPPNKNFCKNDPSKCIASWTGRPGGSGSAGNAAGG